VVPESLDQKMERVLRTIQQVRADLEEKRGPIEGGFINDSRCPHCGKEIRPLLREVKDAEGP
jgi:hypothetical protein